MYDFGFSVSSWKHVLIMLLDFVYLLEIIDIPPRIDSPMSMSVICSYVTFVILSAATHANPRVV